MGTEAEPHDGDDGWYPRGLRALVTVAVDVAVAVVVVLWLVALWPK